MKKLNKTMYEAYKDELARNSLAGFILSMKTDYLMGWVHKKICEELENFLRAVQAKKSPRLMLTMPPRHGKLCADDTDVLTSKGWKFHGDLCVGDEVYGINGRLTKVVAVGKKDIATHKVIFTNGETVDVHLNHEWTVLCKEDGKRHTLETKEILKKCEHKGNQWRPKEPDFFVLPFRVRPDKQPITGPLYIYAIEKLLKEKEGQCIEVAARDGLYLVTRTFIPTHNSEIASRHFPAYVLGRFPDTSIIGTSYSADLAMKMNRDIQRIMETDVYRRLFPASALSEKKYFQSAKNALRNTEFFEIVDRKGTYRSAGVGGGITGMGCDIAIIDDPFKSRADADSLTIRDKVWEWYISTLYTRLSPGGGIIIIQTRWSADDLSGRLLEAQSRGEGDKWRIVNFPAIAEEDEDYRKKGEALHPERFSLERLLSIKQAIGTREWESLYQQHPTIEGGAIFKEEWFKFWLPKDLPLKFDRMVLSWDMTFKEGTDNDYVVGQVWGRKGGDLYLLDQVRARMGFTQTLNAFRSLADKYPQATRKLVEDTANGPAVIDSLKHQVSGIIPIKPDGSKTARAHAITALFESGNVYIPSPEVCAWAQAFITELLQFPNGAHDDQVDAASQALRDLTRRPGLNISASVLRPSLYRGYEL